MPNTQDPIETFRASFKKNELHHFNNAGVAPTSRQAREAVEHWVKRFSEEGTHCIADAVAMSERTRDVLGRVLGAESNQIAFFQSSAAGLSQVAFGLKLNPGDEIITWDQEYPSNFHPWRLACERSGAKLVVAQSGENFSTPIDAIKAVITSRTKLIAFSWVQYRTGAIADIGAVCEMARAKNILTCSDIIQGAGILPFDFEKSGLDFACGGSHKWFVSPVSSGYLIARKDRIDQLSPLMVGAASFGGPDSLPSDTTLVAGALRFEPGSRAFLELAGFGASLEMIEKVGIARIGQEVEWLSKRLMHGLREIGYAIHSPHGSHYRGSIVNFAPTQQSAAKSAEAIHHRLNEAKVSFGKRQPGVRLAPHAFNTAEEIDLILACLR
ncbi:MAG TPA: aminotransferase class V-fold PLP-dependent enzyme [Bdellovibrionales bacterium]|nr:aminotransferase class V-fold PLP-dependent enzyme [Bdellovibrionales bacterium]